MNIICIHVGIFNNLQSRLSFEDLSPTILQYVTQILPHHMQDYTFEYIPLVYIL